MLAFGQPIILERAWPRSRDPFRILHPVNFSGISKDRIVKFCARVGSRSVSLVMTNCPPSGRGHGHVTS